MMIIYIRWKMSKNVGPGNLSWRNVSKSLVATRALFQPMEANPSDCGPQTTVKREEHKMRIEKMCVQSVDRK